jgi:hypothetical protein
VVHIISRQNWSISSQSTDLNASQHLSPLASTTLKADGKSGKYDKMLLLQLAHGSNTNSVHCNYSDIFCAFNKKDEILLLLFNGFHPMKEGKGDLLECYGRRLCVLWCRDGRRRSGSGSGRG